MVWGCPSMSNVGRIQQGLEFLLHYPETVRKIISNVLWAKLQGPGTSRAWKQHEKEEEGEGRCEWNNNVVRQRWEVKTLFSSDRITRWRPRAAPVYQCSLASSTDSAHCFSPVFPQDVGQGLLPKRWGQPCNSLSPSLSLSLLSLSSPDPEQDGCVELGNETDLQPGASLFA